MAFQFSISENYKFVLAKENFFIFSNFHFYLTIFPSCTNSAELHTPWGRVGLPTYDRTILPHLALFDIRFVIVINMPKLTGLVKKIPWWGSCSLLVKHVPGTVPRTVFFLGLELVCVFLSWFFICLAVEIIFFSPHQSKLHTDMTSLHTDMTYHHY